MKYFKLIVFFISLFLLTSCSIKRDFPVMSSPQYDSSEIHKYEKTKELVRGEASRDIIFIIPTSFESASDAARRAMSSYPGCVAIVDGTVTHFILYLPPICFLQHYTVEGKCMVPISDDIKSKVK